MKPVKILKVVYHDGYELTVSTAKDESGSWEILWDHAPFGGGYHHTADSLEEIFSVLDSWIAQQDPELVPVNSPRNLVLGSYLWLAEYDDSDDSIFTLWDIEEEEYEEPSHIDWLENLWEMSIDHDPIADETEARLWLKEFREQEYPGLPHELTASELMEFWNGKIREHEEESK